MGELPAILLAESFDQACLGTSPRMPAQHSEIIIIIIIIQLNKFFARICASIRTSGFIDPLSQSLNRTRALLQFPLSHIPATDMIFKGYSPTGSVYCRTPAPNVLPFPFIPSHSRPQPFSCAKCITHSPKPCRHSPRSIVARTSLSGY